MDEKEGNIIISTVADKIRSMVEIENGQSKSTLSYEEKKNSVSKGNIYDTEYKEVSSLEGYDDSAAAIEDLLKSFQKASETPGSDPIFQNGFSERIVVDSKTYDVALIKATNAVCNNTTSGTYQTFKFQFQLNQTNPDEVETLENEYDMDLSGKKIDLNRPAKTSLKDGLVTSYLNSGNLSLSVTIPVSGNDQESFDRLFQNDASNLISYGLAATLSELTKEGIVPEDLAEAEIKLTSRSAVQEMIRKEAKARYTGKSDSEIEEIVDSIYPAVAERADLKPLTSKSITIGVYATLVEKEEKEKCEWTSISDKWTVVQTTNHVMRYRPIANSVQTFPVTDKVYEIISSMGKEFFGAYVNFANDLITSRLGMGKIDPVMSDTRVPDHPKKLSEVIGVNPKDLFIIKKDIREKFRTIVQNLLATRDDNSKTDTMSKFNSI